MNEILKTAKTLFLSLFGLTIYLLHKPIFYLGFFKSFLVFLFSAVVSGITVFYMGMAYRKVLKLRKVDSIFEEKSVFQAINTKLAFFFSLLMIVTNSLVSIVIFAQANEILGNVFNFFNISFKYSLIFIALLMLCIIIFLQKLKTNIKTKLNFLNTFLIFCFSIYMCVIIFKKSFKSPYNVIIPKNSKDTPSFKDMYSMIFYTFSCQHISIATFVKMKNTSIKQFMKICILYTILSAIGIYFIAVLGFYVVRSEAEFDPKPFKNNFLERMTEPESFFYKNFLLQQSQTFQIFNFIFVILMTYLLINNVALLSEVIRRALNEISIIAINYFFKNNEEKQESLKNSIFFNNNFQILLLSPIIAFLSFLINPEILLKYLSIFASNTICLIIPGLMYYLAIRKHVFITETKLIRTSKYLGSIVLVISGIFSIIIFFII